MKRKTTSTRGLQFVLIDDEEPDEMHEPIGRVFALTIPELRRMVDVLNSLQPIPPGFTLEVRAVRQERRDSPLQRFPHIWRRLK